MFMVRSIALILLMMHSSAFSLAECDIVNKKINAVDYAAYSFWKTNYAQRGLPDSPPTILEARLAYFETIATKSNKELLNLSESMHPDASHSEEVRKFIYHSLNDLTGEKGVKFKVALSPLKITLQDGFSDKDIMKIISTLQSATQYAALRDTPTKTKWLNTFINFTNGRKNFSGDYDHLQLAKQIMADNLKSGLIHFNEFKGNPKKKLQWIKHLENHRNDYIKYAARTIALPTRFLWRSHFSTKRTDAFRDSLKISEEVYQTFYTDGLDAAVKLYKSKLGYYPHLDVAASWVQKALLMLTGYAVIDFIQENEEEIELAMKLPSVIQNVNAAYKNRSPFEKRSSNFEGAIEAWAFDNGDPDPATLALCKTLGPKTGKQSVPDIIKAHSSEMNGLNKEFIEYYLDSFKFQFFTVKDDELYL